MAASVTIADRYALQRPLDQGATGTVWLATDLRLDAPVALKLLDPRSTGNNAARRFLNEARALAQVRHPHVVTVHDHGEHEGSVYVAMEWMRGGSTASHVASHGPAGLQVATAWLRQVLAALHAVHERGLVHRDVKPSNVLLTEDATTKLGDFGIVLLDDEHTRLTTADGPLGTAAYAAPEQFVDSTVDARADLYGAGATFFAWITGTSPMMIYQPELHSELFVGLDPEVVEFIVRATRFEPEQRFASAEAMTAGLDRMVRRVAGDRTPAPAPARASRPSGAPRWLPWLVGAAVVVPGVLAVGAGVVAVGWGLRPSEPVAQAPQPVLMTQPVPVPVAAPPPEARPSPPSALPMGRVFVNGVPPAQLDIGGASRGTTPWTGELPVGEHAVTLRPAEGDPIHHTLTVSASADTRFCWDFRQGAVCRRF